MAGGMVEAVMSPDVEVGLENRRSVENNSALSEQVPPVSNLAGLNIDADSCFRVIPAIKESLWLKITKMVQITAVCLFQLVVLVLDLIN